MVCTRSRAAAEAPTLPHRQGRRPPPPPSPPHPASAPLPKDDGYERCRTERIRENRERMQKLGIADLALKLKANHHLVSPRGRCPKSPSIRVTRNSTPRRSSRLRSVSPVDYGEVLIHKKEKKLRNGRKVEVVFGKEEVYTEEHEKLLGTCENVWTLFADGCGSDGKRAYDQIKGKSCHQCRQKTLGHRTHCRRCEMVQGQFCGDCLYMRYGENVLEVKINPNWICPVCRGICNCSLCRAKRGWPPTGPLYRTVNRLGFKSVAHYLIQTRRFKTSVENLDSAKPISAKKSLPFTDSDEPPESVLENVKLESTTNDNCESHDVGNITQCLVDSIYQAVTTDSENLDSADSASAISTKMLLPNVKDPTLSNKLLVLENTKLKCSDVNDDLCTVYDSAVLQCEGEQSEMKETVPTASIVADSGHVGCTDGNGNLQNVVDNAVLECRGEDQSEMKESVTTVVMVAGSEYVAQSLRKRIHEEKGPADKENFEGNTYDDNKNGGCDSEKQMQMSCEKRRRKSVNRPLNFIPSPDCISGRLRKRQSKP